MANLKDDLDQYLLLQSDQKKSLKIDIKMPHMPTGRFSSLFGKTEPPEANSWLKDAKDSCCPNLVRGKWFTYAFKADTVSFSDSLTTYHRIRVVPGNGCLMLHSFRFLHSHASRKGQTVCFTLYTWKHIFDTKFLFSLRIPNILQTVLLKTTTCGFNDVLR